MRHILIILSMLSLAVVCPGQVQADDARQAILKSIEEAKSLRSKVADGKKQQLELYISQLEKLIETSANPDLNTPIVYQNLKVSFSLCSGEPKNPNVFFGPVRTGITQSGIVTQLEFSVNQHYKVENIQHIGGNSRLAEKVKNSLSRSLFNPTECMRAQYETIAQ